jgi:membrane associated rhomboid family serine protease
MTISPPREPIFNIPPVIIVTIGMLAVIHAVREFVLPEQTDLEALLLFAFIPARYEPTILVGGAVPGGIGADIWTFVTYAFLHGDWVHLGVNTAWLLAFGSPLAQRFGTLRFLAFFAVTAAAGALAHLVTHSGEFVPMIGASASISGAMAGAMRFVFQRGGPVFRRNAPPEAFQVPALSLAQTFRDPRILIFLGMWFAINLVFGLGAVSIVGEGQTVAWQAHVGGFVAGLLLFGAFDRARPPGQLPRDDAPHSSAA